jgi:uncharacterized DUF497 family protein
MDAKETKINRRGRRENAEKNPLQVNGFLRYRKAIQFDWIIVAAAALRGYTELEGPTVWIISARRAENKQRRLYEESNS